MSEPTDRPLDRPDDARALLGSFLGIGGLACVLFLIFASVLAGTPWWAITLLVVVWLGFFLDGVRHFSTRPRRVALLPGAMVLIWFATVVGGAALFGWGS